jgi:hypothetical protein
MQRCDHAGSAAVATRVHCGALLIWLPFVKQAAVPLQVQQCVLRRTLWDPWRCQQTGNAPERGITAAASTVFAASAACQCVQLSPCPFIAYMPFWQSLTLRVQVLGCSDTAVYPELQDWRGT